MADPFHSIMVALGPFTLGKEYTFASHFDLHIADNIACNLARPVESRLAGAYSHSVTGRKSFLRLEQINLSRSSTLPGFSHLRY